MRPRQLGSPVYRRLLGGLVALLALNAFGGGLYGLAGAPAVPTAWLARSPFRTYVVPGLILFTVVGGTLTMAALALWRDHRRARRMTLAAAVVLLGWIGVQVGMIGFVSWLQPVIAGLGLVIAALAAGLPRPRDAAPADPPHAGAATMVAVDAAGPAAQGIVAVADERRARAAPLDRTT